MTIILSPVQAAERTKRALQYFERKGIDIRVEPTSEPSLEAYSPLLQAPIFHKDIAVEDLITKACMIHIVSIVFYTYCSVVIPEIGKYFEGHSGGLGVGELTAGGVIYYINPSELFSAHDFGVFFGAEYGGVCHVTWGTCGNATAAGVGDGVGAFGGRGDWN